MMQTSGVGKTDFPPWAFVFYGGGGVLLLRCSENENHMEIYAMGLENVDRILYK